jgi:hypothetical protein
VSSPDFLLAVRGRKSSRTRSLWRLFSNWRRVAQLTFISSDSGFQGGQHLPHPELKAYIQARSLQVGFYATLDAYLSRIGDALPESDYQSLTLSLATTLRDTAQDAMKDYGVAVGDLIDGNLKLFATETPGRTAVSYEIRYAAKGDDSARPIATVVIVRGEATANFNTRRIPEIRTDEVKFVEQDGSERGVLLGSTLDAGGSLVRREVPFTNSG